MIHQQCISNRGKSWKKGIGVNDLQVTFKYQHYKSKILLHWLNDCQHASEVVIYWVYASIISDQHFLVTNNNLKLLIEQMLFSLLNELRQYFILSNPFEQSKYSIAYKASAKSQSIETLLILQQSSVSPQHTNFHLPKHCSLDSMQKALLQRVFILKAGDYFLLIAL